MTSWKPVPQRLLLIALYGAGVLAAFSPWLIRNAAFTGNPVYPFAYNWFGGRAWSEAQAQQWDRGHALPAQRSSLAGRAHATWDELLASPKFGPAIFILALFGLIVRPDRAAGFLLVWLGLLVLAWATLTHMPGRFAIPAVVPLALLIGRVVPAGAGLSGWRRPFALVAVPLAALGGVRTDFTLGGLWNENASFWARYDVPLGVFVGATELYVHELEPLNRVTPPDAKIWLVGDARVFYIDRDVHYTVVFDRDPWLQFAAHATPEQAVAWLRRENVMYVLFSWTEIDRLARSYGFETFVTREWARRLEAAGLQPVEMEGVEPGQVSLYRVPPA